MLMGVESSSFSYLSDFKKKHKHHQNTDSHPLHPNTSMCCGVVVYTLLLWMFYDCCYFCVCYLYRVLSDTTKAKNVLGNMSVMTGFEARSQHLENPTDGNLSFEVFAKIKGGLAYSQIDQKYWSDPTGGVRAFWGHRKQLQDHYW